MNKREVKRLKRHKRIRKKIIGTKEKPRLCVHKSHKNIYVQLVDDLTGSTLLSMSTRNKELSTQVKTRANKSVAEILGRVVATAAKEKNIERVVFDRAGYQYHGRIKALADSARKAGLKF
ncbi:MAG: 50S ribosomal protein L18 [Candidatus Omnitrophota bacterium]